MKPAVQIRSPSNGRFTMISGFSHHDVDELVSLTMQLCPKRPISTEYTQMEEVRTGKRGIYKEVLLSK